MITRRRMLILTSGIGLCSSGASGQMAKAPRTGVPNPILDRANWEAAEAEGLRPQSIRLRGAAEDLDAVFTSIKDERAGALLALEVPAIGLHARRIIALATAARLPTMFPGDSFF